MSEWITDRRPTAKDADNEYVWVTTEHGDVRQQIWNHIGDRPWMPFTTPEPYVKPKRYTVKWLTIDACWAVMEMQYVATRLTKLNHECDEYREAAERIAAIYEEVMP